MEGRIIPFSMLSGPTGDSLPNLVPLPSSIASKFCLLIRLSGIKSSLTLGAPKGQHINKSSSGDRVATSKLLQPVAAPVATKRTSLLFVKCQKITWQHTQLKDFSTCDSRKYFCTTIVTLSCEHLHLAQECSISCQ